MTTDDLRDENQLSLFSAGVAIETPVLPYGGTSGWSGSDTSLERASRADKDGTTSARQATTLNALLNAGVSGLTWSELASILNVHHGAASGVLSTLHKAGHICRLTERRNKSQVYVLPAYVAGREKVAYKPNVSARLLEDVLTEVLSDLGRGQVETAKARIAVTLQHLKPD